MIAYIALFSALLSRLTALAGGATGVTSFLVDVQVTLFVTSTQSTSVTTESNGLLLRDGSAGAGNDRPLTTGQDTAL